MYILILPSYIIIVINSYKKTQHSIHTININIYSFEKHFFISMSSGNYISSLNFKCIYFNFARSHGQSQNSNLIIVLCGVSSCVFGDCLTGWMSSYIGCICEAFLQCESKGASLN